MSTVTFEFPQPTPAPTGRLPRVTRLLALAHTIDARIRSGQIRNWAEAARLLGVTRARMTQIAHLLSLSPAIQERVLTLPLATSGPDPVTERALRIALVHTDWPGQEHSWARDRVIRSAAGDR